jgi:cobalamin biosynthetic protein CobC
VLASPANPTGHITDPARLSRLAGDMTVVLDQAYADPDPCPPPSDRLIVLRSFGKFYGLPGLRLGFIVASPTIAGRLRALLGDWPVSSAAVAIGTAAYRDAAWRAAQAARIDTMARRLDAVLQRAGLSILGRAPLFRLVDTDDAAALFARLARHAILSRPFADEPRRLRIGLPSDDAALDRLASALEDADD